eukprot:scaffold8314_cov77-Cyclotella_meneghiniana.AAC.4
MSMRLGIASSLEGETLINDFVEWLIANGAYINNKVKIKHMDENNKASPLGLVAIADMDAGEKICQIPPHLIIMPDDIQNSDDCPTIKATCNMLTEKGHPWAKYLLSQTHRNTPEFWSENGRFMLKKMTGDMLPPQYIDETLEELESECHGDVNDPIYLHAAMLVKSRADYSVLVPFYGMF